MEADLSCGVPREHTIEHNGVESEPSVASVSITS
jgi:hypothetical protein